MKRVLGILFIICMLATGFCFAEELGTPGPETTIDIATGPAAEPVSYLSSYKNTSGVGIPEGCIELITKFYDTYYDSLAKLEAGDLTQYFASSYYEAAQVNQKAMELYIEGRKQQPVDLGMTDVEYDLKVTAAKKFSDSKYRLTVKDNLRSKFNFIAEEDPSITSELINVSSTFVLVKKKAGWKVKIAKRNHSGYSMLATAYYKEDTEDYTHEEIDQRLEEVFATELGKMALKNESNAAYLEKANRLKMKKRTADHKYNREAAVEFAQSHVKTRTKVDYSNWGGNCQNYASNMLLAGGIPMDYKGNQLWKHYSMTNNYNNVKAGRTASFIQVGAFYNYAKYNTGYGLVARTSSNPYYAEPGDVLQVGSMRNGSPFFSHSIVCVGAVRHDGKIQDILINSNTLDMINYPLAVYAASEKRLIKIYGWND